MLSRIASTIVLASCVAATAAHAATTAYPTRPVRLVVSFAPGGGVDATARIFAPKLSEYMGQNWVPDNRPGAGGNLASEIVAKATPDGHTVLMAIDTQLSANPHLYDMNINVLKELKPVVILAATDQVVVVHPSVPAKNLKEFIALAKQKPGAFRYGSGGVGSSNHLTAEVLKKTVGIEITHVPYKGAGPSIAAILSGDIQMNVSSPASTVGFVTSGKLRALARTGAKRTKTLADVPTVAELGYPGFDVIQWYGLVVPAATPSHVVERIRNDSLKAMQAPEVIATMEKLGLELQPSTVDGLTERIKKESAMWAAIIKEAGIKLQ